MQKLVFGYHSQDVSRQLVNGMFAFESPSGMPGLLPEGHKLTFTYRLKGTDLITVVEIEEESDVPLTVVAEPAPA